MKENLLHFVWKLQLFSSTKLFCTQGKTIKIFSAGVHNLNSGPDFLNAKIEIDNQLWAGNVEIHVKSSDWYLHNHEVDKKYDSVILHVVWEHDIDVFRKTIAKIPTLVLKQFISEELVHNYSQLFSKNKNWINCENDISKIDEFVLNNWFERLYFERLEQKAIKIKAILIKSKNNWEATLFVLLAKNFGLKINAEAFLNFANSFEFSVVRKVATNLKQLEALFFGQAGLLYQHQESEYFKRLQKEYAYLQAKFRLTPISQGQVQFFRLRPNNFPTIRLSQLASLYHKNQNLFSEIIEIQTVDAFYKLFNVSTSTFWQSHYTFEKESKSSKKRLTKSFIDLLLINTIIPLKFMYLKSLGKSDFSEILLLIEQMKPEKNTIISKFKDLKIKSKNAFTTQALLQLKNEYCNQQKCLQCVIGKELLESKV